MECRCRAPAEKKPINCYKCKVLVSRESKSAPYSNREAAALLSQDCDYLFPYWLLVLFLHSTPSLRISFCLHISFRASDTVC
jgi:hypothetical protein